MITTTKTTQAVAGPTRGKGSRIFLGILLLVLALNAFGGGYYGMAGARDIPLAWLEGSPFHSYFLPPLFLFVVVGGGTLTTAVLLFRGHRFGRTAALATGALLLAWIAAQVSIIGYVSWMQPAVAAAAVLVLVLASRLQRR